MGNTKNTLKGWNYNSSTSDYEYQVYDSSGNVKTIFNEDAALFQSGTKLSSTAAEINALNGVTAGTATASKVAVLGTNKNLDTLVLADGGLKLGSGAGTAVTATAAELNTVDVTAGVLTASKAIVLDSNRALTWSSSSTSGSTSVEPLSVTTTMSGIGGVGGRARFQLDTNVALGGWANALKGQTVFGATGAVTGLGSAICAEMTLSAGTTAGTYAPLEIELNLGTGALTGAQTSLIYASVNGDDSGTFDDNGALISLNGVAIGAGHIFQASAKAAINATHAMKIKVLGVDYFIPCHTSAAFGV